ncbi:MAG TPA: hypothetical protein VK034_21490 [Enhygromyxa sp.]|nr:hypothetical protein [Enhygromyxa sp.]
MSRTCPVVLTLGLITACNDPSPVDDETSSTETQDPGDGDGEPGDGDGEPGDGDGDDPPDIPDGLFAAIPDIQGDKLALAPDHLFVLAQESFFDDARVLKVSKSHATIETFSILTDITFGDMIASDEWLYASSASPVFRTSFDSGESWPEIASFGGVGGIANLVATSSHVFVHRINTNDHTLHRIDFDGGNPTTVLTADNINVLRTNGTRLYGWVDGNVAEIDPQSGALTQVYEGTTFFHVGQSALYFRVGAALHIADFDGNSLVEIVSEAEAGAQPKELAEDGQHLYWATGTANGDNTIGRVPSGGGEVEVLLTLPTTQDPQMLSVDDTHLWWLIAGGEEQLGIWRLTK